MNQPCIKRLRNSILFFFFPLIGLSQATSFDTSGFYKHLVTANLLPEQIAFDKQLKSRHNSALVRDTLTVNMSLAYYKMQAYDSCNENLSRISPTPLFNLSQAKTFVALLILGKKYGEAGKFLDYYYSSETYFEEAKLSLRMLQNQPVQDSNISMISAGFNDIVLKYNNQPKYSAFLAGIYSAVIPGMGKLYLGYKQEALSAFLENVFLGAQATESYIKAGPLSARFIITGALFGLFYGGNIWGSALLAKKQKVDKKKQIDYEIFRYYNTRITGYNQ